MTYVSYICHIYDVYTCICHIYVISMSYVIYVSMSYMLHIYHTNMTHIWHVYDIYMSYVCHIHVIYVSYLWHIYPLLLHIYATVFCHFVRWHNYLCHILWLRNIYNIIARNIVVDIVVDWKWIRRQRHECVVTREISRLCHIIDLTCFKWIRHWRHMTRSWHVTHRQWKPFMNGMHYTRHLWMVCITLDIYEWYALH